MKTECHDEGEVHLDLCDLLQESGCRVLTANDGQEGWGAFREHHYDIDMVLLGLSMPGLTGHRLLAGSAV